MATKKTPVPSGYSTADTYFATRFRQGGRTVYSLDLSPMQIIKNLVTRPDPDRAVNDSNRQIRAKHAAEFADYFRKHPEWVIPGIILRSPSKFKFDVTNEVSGAQFGVLEIDRAASREINILDGQHRILGFFLANEGILAEMDIYRGKLQSALRNDPDGATARGPRKRLAELDEEYARLESERVAIQVYIEPDPQAYRQMFFDISDNALGITASVRSRFDSRKVVNRALPTILEHPLLEGRVDMESDRVGSKSEAFLTAKNVADMTRCSIVGFSGRIGKSMEQQLSEQYVIDRARGLFDALVEAFPPLAAVSLGQLLPSQLRRTSLLGSPTFLRILAGAYYELVDIGTRHKTQEDAVAYFKRLAPHVSSDGSPVYPGSIWIENLPEGLFAMGAVNPAGQRQSLLALHDKILEWAIVPKLSEFLDNPPAPRPAPSEDPLENPDAAPLTLEQAKALEEQP